MQYLIIAKWASLALAILVVVIGVVVAENATQEVFAAAMGIWAGMLSRLFQAEEHHRRGLE